MPRSGGEYIYNSRIVHPIFGIAQSFGDAIIWLMWIYVLAPLAVDPGLTITFNYLGWTGAADWVVSSAWITFVLATLFNVVGFLFVVFGIKIFALTQKIVMFFGIGGCIVIGLVLTFTSHGHLRGPVGRGRGRQRLAELPGLHRQGRRGRRPASCRRTWTLGGDLRAAWSPCRGCSPTPTRSRSSAARSSAPTRPSSGPTSSPSRCPSCS